MKKAGAKKKMIINVKTCEIFYGLKELCLKNSFNMPAMSNKLNGKNNNNTDFLYIENLEVEFNNPYQAKNGREFNILNVYRYSDAFEGGDVAVVQMIDDKKKYTILDRKLAEYITISL